MSDPTDSFEYLAKLRNKLLGELRYTESTLSVKPRDSSLRKKRLTGAQDIEFMGRFPDEIATYGWDWTLQNSNFPIAWVDESRTNDVTRKTLHEIHSRARAAAHQFGVFYVISHHSCPSGNHSGIYTSNQYAKITWDDPAYCWSKIRLLDGYHFRKCPCSPKVKRTHHVTGDYFFLKDADSKFCMKLILALSDIHRACQAAGDKKPRSGIREFILRAVLGINDLILPMPIDLYIEKRFAER